MLHTDRPDAELVELSRRGWAPAFAVLLHRHGPAVRAVVATANDPVRATRDTFVDAMRHLDDRDADAAVRPWLLGLAAAHTRDPQQVPDTAVLTPLADAEVDEVWAELDRRWPDGHRPRRRVPRPIRVAAFVLLLVGLAAAVPVITFTAMNDREEQIEELRATPFEREDETAGPGDELPDDGVADGLGGQGAGADGLGDGAGNDGPGNGVEDTIDLGDVTDDVDDVEDPDADATGDADDGVPGADTAGDGDPDDGVPGADTAGLDDGTEAP